MKRIFSVMLIAFLLVSMISFAASADNSFDTGKTIYEIPEASEISFSYTGVTGATSKPQKNGTLENLIDGDAVNDAAAFDTYGVVLVCNDYIKPTYEGQGNQKAVQSVDAIPQVHFTVKYEEKVTFDALYLSLFQEINHMIATPGGNWVVLEVSNNGKDWDNVNTFYYRPHFIDYTGSHHAGNVEELIVPLGKEVSGTYVRMTFEFAQVAETTPPHYWTYYSNVYEWMGFTELGVAKYMTGDKPKVVTEEEANTPDIVIDGTWVTKNDSLASVYKFQSGVVETASYDLADFEENGTDAEIVTEATGEYSVYINEITLNIGDEETVYTATLGEDGKLTLKSNLDTVTLETYKKKPSVNKPSDNSVESDGDDNDDDDDNGIDYSKPVANNGAASTPDSNETNIAILPIVIVGVVVGILAVVVVVVVVVIILKKKKQ